MELILICKQCGHEEIGETERTLMTKIRMWNHLNREHPELAETFNFKEVIEEQMPTATHAEKM